jgi:hypothetical protein
MELIFKNNNTIFLKLIRLIDVIISMKKNTFLQRLFLFY